MRHFKTALTKIIKLLLLSFALMIAVLMCLNQGYENNNLKQLSQIAKIEKRLDETSWTFSYTGGVQSFTAPYTGKYHFEIYGASGGGASTTYGGTGGISSGDYTILEGETIYIVVGGQGSSSTGGYNGGGSSSGGYGGGGATHIATATGTLASLESNRDAILLVAGGGGGAGSNMYNNSNIIGKGGGDSGGTSSVYSHTQVPSDFFAANQVTGYAFGQGGPGTSGGGAGGGGWYGGVGVRTSSGGGNGGSGHYSEDITSAMTNYSSHIGHGSATITYEGDAYTDATISLLNGGTINGQSNITITGKLGSTQNLDIDFNSDYTLIGWKTIYGDCIVSGTTITFGRKISSIEAIYKAKLKSEEIQDGAITNLIYNEDDNYSKLYRVYSSTDNTNWDYAQTTSATFNRQTKTATFSYTGAYQSYIIPFSGNYTISMYGGSGGRAIAQGKLQNNIGRGGYSYGIKNFKVGEIIYIAVGGQGANGNLRGWANGGWNGGGRGSNDSGGGSSSSDDEASAGGGGATSITTTLRGDGRLSYYENYKDEVLMVAGGGGGASYDMGPGSGGGINGGANSIGQYATQTSGYAFGQGQNGSGAANSDGVGGGRRRLVWWLFM